MEGKKLYLTTPIYYVNGSPHIGHAHTTVMGDIFKRAMGIRGISTYYTTGVDEHGQKNAREIEKSGLTAEEYLDGQCLKFTSLFDKLDIQADYFVRTSRESHKKGVRAILDRLYGEGKIVKKAYSGLYCPGCEQFKTASELDDRGRCPDHLTIPVTEEESNYFFPLEPHREWLISHIDNHDEWISPKIYRNKILDMLSSPLPDLCVSRPRSRVSLGVELPFDRNYVAYVWFDALINYISSLGYPALSPHGKELWSVSCHLMAKDIIKTHCIYWPIMLKALGLKPVKKNLIHGFWVGRDGRKMSKSLGNGVDPHDLIDRYGADPVRAFLAARMGRHEARIGEELFKDFYNGFLANTLGNVYLRSVKLIEKYTDGQIPSILPSREDSSFLVSLCAMAEKAAINEPDFERISILMDGLNAMGKGLNSYVDNRKPWILAKDSGTKKELQSVLRTSIEGVRLLFETAWPVMPETSEQVLTLLASPLPTPGTRHEFRPCRLREGEKILPGKVLFPRFRS